MTSDRPYRPALTWAEAGREIVGESRAQFDPAVVKAFVEREDRLRDDPHSGHRVVALPRLGVGSSASKPIFPPCGERHLSCRSCWRLRPLGCAGADGPAGAGAARAVRPGARAGRVVPLLGAHDDGDAGGRLPLRACCGGGDAQQGGLSSSTMKAPDMPQFPETTVVIRGDKAWMKVERRLAASCRSCRDSRPASSSSTSRRTSRTSSSTRTPRSDGEPAVKITGVLDTAGLFDGHARPARRGIRRRHARPLRDARRHARRSSTSPGEPPAAADAARPEHGGRAARRWRCTSTSRSRT